MAQQQARGLHRNPPDVPIAASLRRGQCAQAIGNPPRPVKPAGRPVGASTMLRVGLIGYGYAGKTFHAPLIRATAGLQITAVASSDAAKVQADLGGVAVLAWPELVVREDIDLVVVATPNHLHHPQALAALTAGRHVVVDKPFALDATQAGELVDVAARSGRLLSVFHNRRWDGDLLTVQRLLREGRLGRVVALESRFDRFRPLVPNRWRDSDGPGGGLWIDLGPHLIDQALRLFGTPEALTLDRTALRDGGRADDWFLATLRYANGPRVTLGAHALGAIPGARFLVHGTQGSLRIDGLDGQEALLKAGHAPGGTGWSGDDGRSALLATGADAAALRSETLPLEPGDYPAYYAGVRDAILGRAPNPVPPGEALAVQRLLDLGAASAAQRREQGL
jgi:predicted dehydrogenase